ncbi:MAG: ATP-binding cassette domain-containing protein [Burkholderiales bacterium]|nr:ATP-binding cassette domain-containing protein [Burkholderiales bacterium]
MTPTAPGIELRQVTQRYGGPGAPLVLKAIDVVIPKGTITTFLGPSGCGKTTLLRLIAGLDAPVSGRILIDGQDVTDRGPAERNVCMVFQNYALFPHLSVIGNVGYGLSVSGVPRDETRQRAQAALASVGLAGLDQRLPGELSGGQQQRVALARALVLEPSAMLFDEPLSNLDARLRRSMRQEIRQLQQRLGLTVAYVVMQAGTIAQAGRPRDLYERPASLFVAGFLGEALSFDAMAQADGTVRIGSLTLHAPPPLAAGPVTVAVRPQAWQIAAPGQGLAGRVIDCAYLGSHLELSVDTALGVLLVIAGDVSQDWRPGQDIGLTLGERGVSIVAASG